MKDLGGYRICLVVIMLFMNTSLFTQDTIVLKVSKQETIRTDTASIIQEQNNISKKLYDLLKANERATGNKRVPANFFSYSGKTISRIEVLSLDPFGPTLDKPFKEAATIFGKAANISRIKTNDNVILKNLLFESGDKVSPFLISDSERLLRQLVFIKDARIKIIPSAVGDDYVVVLVFVKDVYPLGFGFDIRSEKEGTIELWNNNIFGTGNQGRHQISWDTPESNHLGIYSRIRIYNVASTFANLDINYKDEFGDYGYWVKLNRPFFAPGTKFAGGAEIVNLKQNRSFRTMDTVYFERYSHERSMDVWVGKSFELTKNNLFDKYRKSVVLTGRIFVKDYIQQPEFVNENSFYSLHNRKSFIGSISVIQQRFIRTNLIYSFGRTEDLPYGYNLSLLGGYDADTYKNRPYVGFSFASGKYHYRLGYFYQKTQLGSFLNEGITEQSAINVKGIYFTNLIGAGSYKFRFFNELCYAHGYNYYNGDLMSINGNDGIKGLSGDKLFGNQKMCGAIEAVMFAPFKPGDFRFALYGFGNWAIINNTSEKFFDNELYSSVGLGIRVRNENLVLNTIQFKFTYYFNDSPNVSGRPFEITGEPRLRPASFYTEKPTFLFFN